MAKSSKNSDQILGAIVVFLVIIVILAIYIGTFLVPIILFLGSIIYYSKETTLKESINGEVSDYWLSDKEKKELRKNTKQKEKAEKLLTEAYEKGQEANLSKNKDGSFSKRSKLGKEINKIEEKQKPIYHESIGNEIFLEKLPKNRWKNDRKNLSDYVSKTRGFIWGLISWIVLLVYFGIESNWNYQLSMRFGLSTILIPIVVFFIAMVISLISFKNNALSKEPPKVSTKNIDTYEASHNFKFCSAEERS